MRRRNCERSPIALEFIAILGGVGSIPSATLVALHHPNTVDALDSLIGSRGVIF
jgi:hypothetical protein